MEQPDVAMSPPLSGRAASRGCGPRGTSVAAEAPEQPRRQEPDEPAVRRRRAVDLDERRAALLEGEPLARAADEASEEMRDVGLMPDERDERILAVRREVREDDPPRGLRRAGDPRRGSRRPRLPRRSRAVSSARGSGLVKSASGLGRMHASPRAAFLNRLRPRGVSGRSRSSMSGVPEGTAMAWRRISSFIRGTGTLPRGGPPAQLGRLGASDWKRLPSRLIAR